MINTKLKKPEEVSFVDYGKLKKEIKRLENDKRGVIFAINTQSNKLSGLVKEEIEIKASNDKLVAVAKAEAKVIIAEAKEKRSEAIKIETKIKGKIAEAEKSKKASDDLINSNEGKEKNLAISKESVSELKAKLTKVLGLIRDVI